VKRRALGWGAFALVATIGLVLARVFEPGRLELELDVYLLALGSLALLNVVILIRESYPLERPVPQIARVLEREEEEPTRLPELQRVERELTMATATAFDLHTRLRPLAREIATARLASRGRRLEESEDELGEELWALVRPDRPVPSDRHGAGVSVDQLLHVVERLETL
jgi:hypothetical protein